MRDSALGYAAKQETRETCCAPGSDDRDISVRG